MSVATFWEIAIKISINKLELQLPLNTLKSLIWENAMEILPIRIEHKVFCS